MNVTSEFLEKQDDSKGWAIQAPEGTCTPRHKNYNDTAPQNGQKRFLEVGLVNMRDTEKTKNVPEPSQAKEQFAIGAKVNS